MKKIILLSIFLMSSANADTIQEYYNAVSNNYASSVIEKRMESEAIACSKGDNRACLTLGVGSFASSLWKLDTILIKLERSGKNKAVRILKRTHKLLQNKKNSSNTQRNNSNNKSRYTLILPKTNINGYQVIIYVTKTRRAYIQIDDKRIGMTRNGKFLSTARILSLLPSNIRDSNLLRKKIISAKIQWKNGH